MFTKNFNNLPESLIEATKKIMTEASNEAPNIQRLTLTQEEISSINELMSVAEEALNEYVVNQAAHEKITKERDAGNEAMKVAHNAPDRAHDALSNLHDRLSSASPEQKVAKAHLASAIDMLKRAKNARNDKERAQHLDNARDAHQQAHKLLGTHLQNNAQQLSRQNVHVEEVQKNEEMMLKGMSMKERTALMNEEMTPSNLSTRTKKSLVSALHDHQKNGYDELSPHLENAWKGRGKAGSHPDFDNLHPKVQNHLVKAYHTFAIDAPHAVDSDYFDHKHIAKHLDSAVKAHNKKMNEEPIDEISRGLASRYISKAKATDPEKREKGIGLALQKKYGDKKYGTTEPKVKATEEEVMPSGMSMKERTAFHMAAAAAAKQGKPHFGFGGKKFKTTMQKDVAHKMTEARKMKLADYDDSDEDPEGGSRPSEHIMNQLRKASMTMKKEHPVKYSDGKTGMVQRHVAKALVNHYNSLSKAHQKETMQSEISKSHKHLTNYHDRLHESMYDPTLKGNKKTLVEKQPKKLDEVPVETMKQVKMVNQEEDQVKHKEVIDPNTDKNVQVKHRKEMDPNTDKSIQEREMTPAEKAKREKIVMALKKKMSGFKDRYGERAKDVMYATATKQAMKEEDDAAPKGKTMTGEKKDGVNVKPEMINRGSGGIKSTTT